MECTDCKATNPEGNQFGWIHEMNCSSDNELLVGELLNWRVQKLTVK